MSYIKKVYIVYKTLSKLKISYLYGIWEGGILAWPSKYILGFRFVYSYMDSGFSNIENKNLLNHEKLPLLFADKIDFLSKNLETYVLKNLNHKVKSSSVTPCSFIDYTNYYPVYPKENIVVFSARLTPIKNPILFLESIEIVNSYTKETFGIQYYILGEGELSGVLKEIMKKKGLSNVKMEGFVKNTYEYLQKSKVFISIQESNNYPSQSLLEAMACENAIIASDVGETRLLVTEEEGMLVDLNPESIAKAILELFSHEELIIKLGRNGREKAIKDHSIEKYMEYFYSLEK
jgi:glycosyltransferase involved in cell wall biosynthesis